MVKVLTLWFAIAAGPRFTQFRGNPDFPSRVFTPAVLVMVSHALSDRRSHTPVMPGT
jgi:hypothetical protein